MALRARRTVFRKGGEGVRSQLREALRSLGRSFAPSAFPYARFALALAIGGAGGLAFSWLQLPLPWMLGPMTACTLASLMQAPVAAPPVVRPPMTVVIGVMLGAGFAPEVVESATHWLPTLAGLAAFVLIAGTACVAYFRKAAGYDWPTAYFAGMPGGLIEMVIVGDEKGGNARTIALVHSARILLVVLALPFLIQVVSGTTVGPRARLGTSILDTPWTDELAFVLTALAGVVLGRTLRLPAHLLVGPMVASAVVHVTGLSRFVPPTEVVIAAQLVLGTTIGCRFAASRPWEILRVLWLSVGSTVILLAITFLFALGISRVSDYDVVPLLLAFSPGGLAEMSLVALSLGIEVAFVATHHIVRVVFVMAAAGPVFGLLGKRSKPPSAPT
jgi:membrane AbrB-like protein